MRTSCSELAGWLDDILPEGSELVAHGVHLLRSNRDDHAVDTEGCQPLGIGDGSRPAGGHLDVVGVAAELLGVGPHPGDDPGQLLVEVEGEVDPGEVAVAVPGGAAKGGIGST